MICKYFSSKKNFLYMQYSNILQIWSLFSLEAASFEEEFRAQNIGRSKDNVQTEGELTRQSFVLMVMFIGYIQSYWKWSKLKFPCCSCQLFQLSSVLCSESLCIVELWSEILGEMHVNRCLQFAHICPTFNKILTAVEQNKMTGKIKYQTLSVTGKDLGRNKMYCMWWIVQ